jgi:hypothetical protein
MIIFPVHPVDNFVGMGFPFFDFMFFGVIWWIVKIIVFIWVVLDILKRNDMEILEKILWLLIVWFLGIIGAILYYILSHRK